ncbi:NADH-ubiquinone oxidoreductase [Fervidicella metallireducens AeB]|uniref:NADH-ubiquinone oxidoreductase n=2 Tax=Fervidicella TaxID=1403538 RepID=A0A017RX48_9CLOT|nr:NADH-ubiquinone oxidoreductase [Fervidicella metallireducens AeB]
MEQIVLLLLLIPLIFSIVFIYSNKKLYKPLSFLMFFICSILSIFLAYKGSLSIRLTGQIFKISEGIITLSEILMILYLFKISVKHHKIGIFILTVIQTIITLFTIFTPDKSEILTVGIDKFSLAMLLIINIVGTLIVIFANGYISEYEHHHGIESKQKLFYPIICLFLSAMNGLVVSDSLSMVYFFWEITTITSFILISYNGDDEAYKSGFRALFLNLIGGICFGVGNILLKKMLDIDTLSGIIQHGSISLSLMLPVFLLCIAGFVKSAQMPFQSWLLGAMVAPTPVSALLHSSTMVKAGVYLIVKLSPAYAGTRLGTVIAIYGAFTFFICSAIAVAQRNAKRILAYSTIANLGLIICSAGIGTGVAVSAAIILIIFHAISKALLFLCTGQIEHTIGSRDIEDMTGLIRIAPVLSILTSFGIISMILPPFGVLVTKWMSIEAAGSNPFVASFLVLGSALTTLYYTKWLGSILAYPVTELKAQDKKDFCIFFPLWALGFGVLMTSIFITPIFNNFVSPEVNKLLKKSTDMYIKRGEVVSKLGTFNEAMVFIALGLVVLFVILMRRLMISSANIKSIYMCGENNFAEGENYFRSWNGKYEKAKVSNLYFDNILDEKALTTFGYVVSSSIIIICLLGGLK